MTGSTGGPGGPADTPPGGSPVLRIVRGTPDADEVAALLAVLAAAAAGQGGAEETTAEGSRWAEPERLLRRPVAPTGWWGAGLPG